MLERRTPLKRTGFLARGAGLARTAMKPKRGRTKAERRSVWSEDAGKKALKRRSSCCERCGSGGPLEWHHRKNRSRGGEWNPANGLRLCALICHPFVTQNPEAARAGGWSVLGSQDPAAVPFEHFSWGLVRITDDSDTYHLVRKGQSA
ncbi:HNH endonuclease signature motif containing protein [Amycolatopsis rhabdoformis]|uniref:HNH endonuclease signature motif containing protein n=1 Tax=Amycolatopsis rhabdoformis TaxID=1448059 RepID=A0ABZ1HXP8_9PSEU|nr:HNH endonuclease signature motif containing protein [Amycolatopsis rhabdoformis]WSE26140.1 HNH endonuclease signature motif containing protein [Amycolatopsis rhabdoformis]